MQIYLDNAATTPPLPEVVDVMSDAMRRHYGNPSSLHRLGEESSRLLQQAREVAAACLGVQGKEVFFTSGATEANNTALRGICKSYANRGRHILASAVEHPSVKDVLQDLARDGFEVSFLPVNDDGVVDLAQFHALLRDDTLLVSVMQVNNEMGALQPIREIGEILKKRPKTFFHVDGVQGYGKVTVDPKAWGVDLLSLSAHKFHGPKGVGLLYKRAGLALPPLLMGGGQEGGLRSGTENLHGIVGMAKAMQEIQQRSGRFIPALWRMKEKLVQGLEQLEGVHLNGKPLDKEVSVPHILNASFPGLKPEVLVHALEQQGIYVSTKSACSSKEEVASDILLALGLPYERAASTIRFSLCYMNTEEEIEQVVKVLHEVVPNLFTSFGGVLRVL